MVTALRGGVVGCVPRRRCVGSEQRGSVFVLSVEKHSAVATPLHGADGPLTRSVLRWRELLLLEWLWLWRWWRRWRVVHGRWAVHELGV